MPHQLADKKNSCLNCDTVLHSKFCDACGQVASTGRITFKETIINFFGVTFALEGPLWLTLKLLIVNPGKLFKEYIEGKRKTYYRPIAFFILITAAYLIIRAWIDFDPLADESVKNDLEDIAVISSKFNEVIQLMSANINNILFLLVFSIAIVFKLFFRKNYNLAEYTSMALFIVGIYTLFKIIVMLIAKFAEVDLDNMEFVILFLLIGYSTFSLFQQKDFWSVVKYTLVGIFSIILYILISLILVFVIVTLKE